MTNHAGCVFTDNRGQKKARELASVHKQEEYLRQDKWQRHVVSLYGKPFFAFKTISLSCLIVDNLISCNSSPGLVFVAKGYI